MYTPQFPYKGNQLILSSDRVMLHAENDAIFILGKQAIGLSSTKTINLDANERVIIACDKIELGYKAESDGEPVVLGKKLNDELVILLDALALAGDQLKSANATNLGTAMIAVHSAGLKISLACQRLKELLNRKTPSGKSNSLILSKNTFTK